MHVRGHRPTLHRTSELDELDWDTYVDQLVLMAKVGDEEAIQTLATMAKYVKAVAGRTMNLNFESGHSRHV